MPTPEDRLTKLGHALPEPPAPVASYVPAVQVQGLLYVSGQIPIIRGELMATGPVPTEVSIDRAIECARQCALNALGVARAELGELSRITRVVRLGGFVACGPGFGEQPRIINGASDLMLEVFGGLGKHARAAVGVSALPLNVPVEIEFLFDFD